MLRSSGAVDQFLVEAIKAEPALPPRPNAAAHFPEVAATRVARDVHLGAAQVEGVAARLHVAAEVEVGVRHRQVARQRPRLLSRVRPQQHRTGPGEALGGGGGGVGRRGGRFSGQRGRGVRAEGGGAAGAGLEVEGPAVLWE